MIQAGLIFLLAASAVWGKTESIRYYDSIYDTYTLRYQKNPNHRRERYSIYVIRGFDYTPWFMEPDEVLSNRLISYVAPWDRRRLRNRRFMEQTIEDVQKEARMLRQVNRGFVYENYFERGPFDASTKPPLTQGITNLKRHDALTIMVTRFRDPRDVYDTLSLSWDRGNGFPTQIRLRHHGLPKIIHPIHRRVAKIRYLALDEKGKLMEYPELSEALSNREYIEGFPLEFKARVRGKTPPLDPVTGEARDFMPVIMTLLVANQYTLFSPVLIPSKFAPRIMSQEERAKMDDLKRKYPFVPDALLYPEKQIHPLTSFIYNHVFGSARKKIFHDQFAFDFQFEPLRDPHQDAISNVGKLHREGLENDLLALMERRPDYELVKEGNFSWNGGLPAFREAMCPGLVLGYSRLGPGDVQKHIEELDERDELLDYEEP